MSADPLESLRKRSKALLRDARADEPEAVERLLVHHPNWRRFWRSRKTLKLADCQLVLARECGFNSWPRLKRAAESTGEADLNETGEPRPSQESGNPYFEMVDRLKIRDERMRWGTILSAKPGQMGRANRGQPLPEQKIEALIWGLSHDNAAVRWQCLEHLDAHPDPRAVPDIVRLLKDPVPRVRWHAIHALACDACKAGKSLMDAAIRDEIVSLSAHDSSPRVRRYAAEVAASAGGNSTTTSDDSVAVSGGSHGEQSPGKR